MKLYFLRHGEADWPNWDRPDSERPLTEKGRDEMREVAKFLKRLGVKVDAILSSPLPRAAQTAAFAAEALEMKVREESALKPGFDARALKKLIANDATSNLMLVGHEPDLSEAVETLTGGAVKMAKAGIACVEWNSDGEYGQLLWLAPPKISTL